MKYCSAFLALLAVGAPIVSAGAADDLRPLSHPLRSASARKLTGDGANLRSIVGEPTSGGNSYYQLTPIPAQGAVTYGPGVSFESTYELTGGTNERLFFELNMGNWGGFMTVWQATIDFAPGYSSGQGNDLQRPVLACDAGSTDQGLATCTAAFGRGSRCSGVVPNTCRDAFINSDGPPLPGAPDPDLVCPGISQVSQSSMTFGSTPIDAITKDFGQVGYGGVLVVEVPAGAAGTYTIDFLLGPLTFMIVDTAEIQIAEYRPGIIDIPVGKCCAIADDTCEDDTTAGACAALDGIFINDGTTCDDGCTECVIDLDCDDGDACTLETCVDSVCDRSLVDHFDPATQCCDGSTGTVVEQYDGDDCTIDTCDRSGVCGPSRDAAGCGTNAHTPTPTGTTCDDGDVCTYDDTCNGFNSSLQDGCRGIDVNRATCFSSSDCARTTGNAFQCVDGRCTCAVSPPLTFDLAPSGQTDSACFDDHDTVTTTIHVGPAIDTITGAELAISYDSECVELVDLQPVPPFHNILFLDDSEPGELYIGIGIDLGDAGVSDGDFDLLTLNFQKRPGCTGCSVCFTDVNPRHTRLTNDAGATVSATSACSEPIQGNGVMTLTTPDGGTFNTVCDTAFRDVHWDEPSASDACALTSFECSGTHRDPVSNEILDASSLGLDPMSGGTFPVGDTTFCCLATDACGDRLHACWTVTVVDQTALEIDLQLSPTMSSKPGSGIDRCIKFEVFSSCVEAPLVFEESVTFGGLYDFSGRVSTTIKIPTSGQFECITARDPLHTLRSCYTFDDSDCDADGVLHATFSGDPFFGGNWLVGGNLDGFDGAVGTPSVHAIDITDFGVFLSQYPSAPSDGNTPCGTAGPDADINGDGLVDLLDFTFVSTSLLRESKDCCCPVSSSHDGSPRGRTSITVSDAQRAGDLHMADADLNDDGVIDVTDIGLLLQGVMKQNKSPRATPGASR